MAKITKEAALLYHSQGKPGKIEVVPTKPYSTQTDLSLAYSPGVAEPCLEIEKEPANCIRLYCERQLSSRYFQWYSRSRTRRHRCIERKTCHGR